MRYTLFLSLLLAACTASTPEDRPAMRTVNVYTHRHYDTDKELFARFTARSGIAVKVVQASDDELMNRLAAEGERSPCDVLITADAGRLGMARERRLLRPVVSELLDAQVPAHLRDPEGHWFGLTRRARVLACNRERVAAGAIATWADLTRPEWKGRVLVRGSENLYNQSLLAAMIAHLGPEKAGQWARGIVANMARPPKGNDTDQLMAVAEGIGDAAIVNTYYVGRLLNSDEPEKRRAAETLMVLFPTIDGHGVHMNVSGGGVARHAPHPLEAIALLEFLSGPEAQALFAEANHEYPVASDIPWSETLRSFGTFDPDTLSLDLLWRYNADAVKLFDAAGWR
jgi:iron(III) transport system substrate-binding protein